MNISDARNFGNLSAAMLADAGLLYLDTVRQIGAAEAFIESECFTQVHRSISCGGSKAH